MANHRESGQGHSLVVGTVFVFLTLLVIGIDPFERGIRMASDDLNFFYHVDSMAERPFVEQLFTRYPADGWNRLFAIWPFVMASHSPAPVVAIHVFYAIAWLLSGLAAARLVREVLPASKIARYLAGVLTLTATSDFQTLSVVYGPHLFGIALFFFGIVQLLRFAKELQIRKALGAWILLTISFLTCEYTYPCVFVLPLLIWGHVGNLKLAWRPILLLTSAFALPLGLLFLNLFGADSYASGLVSSKLTVTRLAQFIGLGFMHNFWPVAWANRVSPDHYDIYASVYSVSVMTLLSAMGAAAAILGLRRVSNGENSRSSATSLTHKRWILIGTLAALTFIANAGTARLGGDFFIRSHFVSRIWASMLIAVVLASIWRRPVGVWMIRAICGTFVFLGIWGAMERQSFLHGHVLHEARELRSLRAEIPSLTSPAKLLLVQPPRSPAIAAFNNPNAVPFLWNNRSAAYRIEYAPNFRFAYSKITATADGQLRIIGNAKEPFDLDPSQLVIAFRSRARGEVLVLDELPAGFVRRSTVPYETYSPEAWISPNARPLNRVLSDYFDRVGESESVPAERAPITDNFHQAIGDLANRVTIESLTPYAIEDTPAGPLVWMGTNRTNGYSALVWSDTPETVRLLVEITPGPDGADQAQSLTVRVQGKQTAPLEKSSRFTYQGAVAFTANIQSGPNIVEFWIKRSPDQSSTPEGSRQLMAALTRVLVSPR